MACLQSFAEVNLETLFPFVGLCPALFLSWHFCLICASETWIFSITWCRLEPLIWGNFVAGTGEHQY